MYKKTISYCVKDAAGRVYQEGKIGSTRRELDEWIRTMSQPRTVAMEATIFTGWIYDHLLPHAEKVKVAHPLMFANTVGLRNSAHTVDIFVCRATLIMSPCGDIRNVPMRRGYDIRNVP